MVLIVADQVKFYQEEVQGVDVRSGLMSRSTGFKTWNQKIGSKVDLFQKTFIELNLTQSCLYDSRLWWTWSSNSAVEVNIY